MNKYIYTCLLGLLWGNLLAQQDPMFTNYHFNSLIFNPAYAGANEHLTANLIHRQQGRVDRFLRGDDGGLRHRIQHLDVRQCQHRRTVAIDPA